MDETEELNELLDGLDDPDLRAWIVQRVEEHRRAEEHLTFDQVLDFLPLLGVELDLDIVALLATRQRD